MARAAEAIGFFAPDCDVLQFPAWDCLPYDRVSPNVGVVGQRIETLTRLLDGKNANGPGRIVLTTVSAFMQRIPARETLSGMAVMVRQGDTMPMKTLIGVLERNGYQRIDTVMEPGEYAVRGGLLDVFPTGSAEPLRLDFFGDELETLRLFDPMTQRTSGEVKDFTIKPVSEVFLNDDAVALFRSGYRSLFGAVGGDDPLYLSVSEGRRHIGMEHWLPLFQENLETLLDYLPDAPVTLDHQAEEVRDGRLEQIEDHYRARKDNIGAGLAMSSPYHPIEPQALFMDMAEWDERLKPRTVAGFSPFSAPEKDGSIVSAGGRAGRDFADIRANPDANVFDALASYVRDLAGDGRRAVLAAWSEGARDRLEVVLREHGIGPLQRVDAWREAVTLPLGGLGLCILGLERGFVADEAAIISEQDVLGDRMVRPAQRRLRAENFISEASALGEGDLVVHMEHGIGRYDGLETLAVSGAPHDCLRLVYDGGDKLYVPVENIEVLSRYGSDQGAAQLDRLGGVAWQGRKARLKQRIREMAAKLIAMAAAREMEQGDFMQAPEGMYDEFAARFPYSETDDQSRAIEAVIGDLSRGRPMDRLVCGDVGFGKTEVALRAAFVSVMSGFQVAVVVPTTLLARQHHRTFVERFAGLPVRIGQISRMVTTKDAKAVREGLAEGKIDIVVGTHALLAKGMKFKDLGLLVIDEEQHFGVAHKERLKELKSGVHVLTLTATPIPRTLQMALTGVKELSLISTPPVDRLAVRTFVLPYDPVVIREALLREHFRGGQAFYVCPRVADIDKVAKELSELVPEVKMGIAHGRMAARELEDVMTAFADGRLDVLLCTNIVESGLDVPSANTLIVHRSDMFGLGQLYQLRGRVGRSKTRAYAYMTLPPRQKITPSAEKRLQVMQALDTLGAGFSLASHDLDIRGAGNLLGEEQSGHIREVGIELYQQMLEEAVADAKGGGAGDADEKDIWSPQINIGMPVLIPEAFIADLGVRLSLYRRLASLGDDGEIESFAAEMVDRFGPLPDEVENLLKVVSIKVLCRKSGVEKVDAGPKGAVISFRNNQFSNPAGLVAFINEQVGTAKLRPDHKLVLMRGWDDSERRLSGVLQIARKLSAVAASG
ncbi:MAG: transcription-repair coupling factor [Rhodospirillales bacterium]|nr:transcription-repair coupling factor [Rhodospirillales bacterium]